MHDPRSDTPRGESENRQAPNDTRRNTTSDTRRTTSGTKNGNTNTADDPDRAAAERLLQDAVRGRQKLARRYVRTLRRLSPRATPAELVRRLEKQYLTAVTGTGQAGTVGHFLADAAVTAISAVVTTGIGMAAGGRDGSGTTGSGRGSRTAGRAAGRDAKSGSRRRMLGPIQGAVAAAGASIAVRGMQNGVDRVIPVATARAEFEVTALFALAVADIHGLRLSPVRRAVLVRALLAGPEAQPIVRRRADAVAYLDPELPGTDAGEAWVRLLAEDVAEDDLSDLTRDLAPGGASAGFGRPVIDAARIAFPAPPAEFPEHLAVGREQRD